MTSIREWAEENNKRFTDKIIAMKTCSEELKVGYPTVRAQYSRLQLWSKKTLPSKNNSKSPILSSHKGRSLADFKKEFDKNTYIPEKIKAALKELGDGWEYEHEFSKRSGVNYTDLNIFKPEFEEHFVYIKKESKKIWCGTKTMAKQLKELIS